MRQGTAHAHAREGRGTAPPPRFHHSIEMFYHLTRFHFLPPSAEYHTFMDLPGSTEDMASNPAQPPRPPKLLDNPLAPDVFADDAAGIFLLGNNVRITLSSWRVSHVTSPGPVSRVVIGRLVMPLIQAEALVKNLSDFLEQNRKQAMAQHEGPTTLQ